jgi:hypothetical protein
MKEPEIALIEPNEHGEPADVVLRYPIYFLQTM